MVECNGQAGVSLLARRPLKGGGGRSTLLPTSKMIEAGIGVLNAHTSEERRVLPDEEIVESIWLAMDEAAQASHSRTKRRTI